MALAQALLAALSQEAGTGYDLARRFDSSMGNFWHASHQQIYRELTRMEAQGWLSSTLEPQAGKPTRKVYALTPEGLAALQVWLQHPVAPAALKDALLLKVYAGAHDPAQIVKELQTHQTLHQAKLAEYLALEQSYFSTPETLPLAQRFIYFTLRAGLHYERQWLAWCEETLDTLNALSESESRELDPDLPDLIRGDKRHAL